VHNNDLSFGCEAEEEQEQLIALEDVLLDGMADKQQLLELLMQHAESLGLTLDQLGKSKYKGQISINYNL